MKVTNTLRDLIGTGNLTNMFKRLLPKDAYPPQLSWRERVKLDRILREHIDLVPTEPGVYLDATGSQWILDSEGGWTDSKGEWRGPEYSPIIAAFIINDGDFTRVDYGDMFTPWMWK